MPQVRILLADNHEIVRLGVRSLLSSQPRWEVCGEATNGQELIREVNKLSPDIVITELALRGLNGVSAAREILRRQPGQKILALTYCDSEVVAQQALEAGVRGLLLKSDAAVELAAAVEALTKGALYFTRRVSEMLLKGVLRKNACPSADIRHRTSLTAREKQILRAIAYGMSNRKISEAFGLTVRTVDSHRSNLMRKLDLHSVAEVVLYAVRNNMLFIENRDLAFHTRGPSSVDRSTNDCHNQEIVRAGCEVRGASPAATASAA